MFNLKAFWAADKEYFRGSRSTITTQNNRMLKDGCIAYGIVLLFYTILSFCSDAPPQLLKMYLAYDALHLLISLAYILRPIKWRESFFVSQLYCLIFEIAILSFFALEGAFTFADQHSLYVPIAGLLVQILFINRAVTANLLNLTYVASYALLSVLHKTPAAYTNDIYIALATYVSATIGYILISGIRHRESIALQKYESLSRIDRLTGLLNKATIEDECLRALENSDFAFVMMIIDLDCFKQINDSYGHIAGDEVLSSVGSLISEVYSESSLCGRFGGDEFLVLQKCGADQAKALLMQFRRRLSELTFTEPQLKITCSIGIAERADAEGFRSLASRADLALYEVKNSARGGYRFG